MAKMKLKKRKDIIPGGLADKKQPSDFDSEALKKGLKVELEHTTDPHIAVEIAMDHLTEDPAYYDKLAKMEKGELKEMKFKIKKKLNENSLLEKIILEEIEAELFIEQILSSHIEMTELEEGLINFVKSSFNAAKQEIGRVKQMAGDKAYAFLKAGVGKINDIIAKLQSMGFINKHKMRHFQMMMKVFLIPKHAKFLASIMIAILKSLVVSNLQGVLPTVLVTKLADLQKVQDYEEKFLKPINDFINGLSDIFKTLSTAMNLGKEALYKFCKYYLGIDLEEVTEYIPDILLLIKDLAAPARAVTKEFGVQLENK